MRRTAKSIRIAPETPVRSIPPTMKNVVIHSDGGCHGNPGPGGWAAVLEYGPHRRELSGGELATTNNRMELMAAIRALAALKEPCGVEFFTDSEYLKNGIARWLAEWKANGWRTKKKQPVKNDELWRELEAAAAQHTIEWKWVKGHAGHTGNERCDQLSQIAIDQIKKAHSQDQLNEALAEFTAREDKDPAQQTLI
jgi:ribonuclease HI